MKVSFRIVSDFEFENDLHKQHYELFPKLDSSAPSAKNLAYLKRKATKEKNNGSTLSSFLGYPLPQAAPATPKVSLRNIHDLSLFRSWILFMHLYFVVNVAILSWVFCRSGHLPTLRLMSLPSLAQALTVLLVMAYKVQTRLPLHQL